MVTGGVPPFIADEGRDGHPFAHIDFASDAGAWADALRFTVNIRIIPHVAFQRPLDAVEGRDNPEALPPVITPFHEATDSPEVQHNHD